MLLSAAHSVFSLHFEKINVTFLQIRRPLAGHIITCCSACTEMQSVGTEDAIVNIKLYVMYGFL